ncbi:MAG: S1C family serine protease [Deltaproteobacteria bacterium]
MMPRRAAALCTLLTVCALAPRVGAQTVLEDHSERVVRATVTVSVGGQVRSRGVVLADDGRAVTALAPLGTERNVTLRYANGRTQPAFVVGTDPNWGIALLQPRGGAWRDGLPLATAARGNTPVRWVAGDDPRSTGGLLRRRRTYVGSGSDLLRDAWELDPAPSDASVGSGIANAAGQFVALIVAPDPSVPAGGAPALFGVPASVIEAVVQAAGNTARPWLGLVARNPRREDTVALALNGLRVTEVTPGGPADHAGVRAGRPGDTIVASGDREIHTVEDLGAVLEPLHPGDTVSLRVMRGGNPVEVRLELAAFPPMAP